MSSSRDDLTLIGYLQAALDMPQGAALDCATPDDARNLRAKLYPIRKAHPHFLCLSFLQRGSTLHVLKSRQVLTDDPFAGVDQAYPEPEKG